MNIKKEKEKLEIARKKQRDLRKEIDALRQNIREAGQDPDAPKIDLVPRNKEIYKKWKDGNKFVDIAKEYNLSTTTISSVCNRIEMTLERRGFHYQKYKDLLPYKD